MLINNNIIDKGAICIIEKLMQKGYEAYLVGGCVRDMLMGIEPKDWDICTNAMPEEIKRVMKENKIHTFDSGIKHGTITAVFNNENYEITTYRSESDYSDCRHPDKVEFIRDIHKDLKRRDFTINAMAYNPLTNELIDDFNGHEDLKYGIIKAVGKASERFNEDSLRILRALRFAVKYQFSIDAETSLCMHRQRGLLVNISKERITAELEKMLTCGKFVKAYFIEYKDIIGTIIPELIKCFNFNQNNKYHKHDVYEHILSVVDCCKTTDFEIKLAALLHDIGKPDSYTVDGEGHGHFYGHPELSEQIAHDVIAKDLRLSVKQREKVIKLVLNHDMAIVPTKKSVKRAIVKFDGSYEALNDWFTLKQADMDDHIYPDKDSKYIVDIPKIKEVMQELLAEQSCLSIKNLEINGNIIMQITGTKPGKHIGEILNTLLKEVIDEKIVNEKNVLEDRALQLFRKM